MFLVDFIIVFLLGALCGFIELLNRYSRPSFMLKCWTGSLYLFLNGIASVAALVLLVYIKNYNLTCTENPIKFTDDLLAGVSAMVLLRSTLINYQYKEKNINVGLGVILQILLDAVEKSYDIALAKYKMKEIPQIMEGVDFYRARAELTSLCINFRESLSKEEVDILNEELDSIKNSNIFSNKNKSIQLGQILSKYFSIELLEQAVNVLKQEIEIDDSSGDTEEMNIEYWIKQLKEKTDE